MPHLLEGSGSMVRFGAIIRAKLLHLQELQPMQIFSLPVYDMVIGINEPKSK